MEYIARKDQNEPLQTTVLLRAPTVSNHRMHTLVDILQRRVNQLKADIASLKAAPSLTTRTMGIDPINSSFFSGVIVLDDATEHITHRRGVMVVEVVTMDAQILRLGIGQQATGLMMKKIVQQALGVPVSEQLLVIEGSRVPLDDASAASVSGLEHGATITCIREEVIEVQLQTFARKGCDGAPRTFCTFHVAASTPLDCFLQRMSEHRNSHVTGEPVEFTLSGTVKGIRKFKVTGDPNQPVGELLAKPVARISCEMERGCTIHTFDPPSAPDGRLRRCVYT